MNQKRINLNGLGIDPATATMIATVAVKGTEAIINAITRPRVDEHWAGAGEYEERFLREMFFSYPNERYELKNPNHPFLVEMYDFLVSYGKAQYPNKRGMVGAGDDMKEVAKRYVQEFVRDSGGAEKFAFLFKDLQTEAVCNQQKEALTAQITEAKKAIRTKAVRKTVTNGLIVGVPIIGAGFLAYWLYRRYQQQKTIQSNEQNRGKNRATTT